MEGSIKGGDMLSHSSKISTNGLVLCGMALAFSSVALFMLSLGVGGGLAKSPESHPAAPTATHWYVATNGLDIHDCLTPATACKTIFGAYAKAAASGDTIHVAAGQFTETISVAKDLTIIGTHPDRGLVTIINGALSGSVFTVNSSHALTLTGATLRNSKPTPSGGGLIIYGRLVGNDLVFNHIDATQYGAALYVTSSGKAILDDISISANTVYTSAGGFTTRAPSQ